MCHLGYIKSVGVNGQRMFDSASVVRFMNERPDRAAVAAEPVFSLFGKQGLGTNQMPGAGEPILHTIGYYMHAGGHGTLPGDWERFLQFMEMHLHPSE